MKSIKLLLICTLFSVMFSFVLSEPNSTYPYKQYKVFCSDTTEPDSVNSKVYEIINEVNKRSSSINKIIATGEIAIKTSKLDNEGEIMVKANKPNEFWFMISGSFAFISKDAFLGYFNRDKFIYYNNLDNYSIEGPTTDENIKCIIKIKANFDDVMNGLTGTVSIPIFQNDTISFAEDKTHFKIKLLGKTYKRCYWIQKQNYVVNKFEYYNKKFQAILRVEFSDFVKSNLGYYAKKVKICNPLTFDELKINFQTYNTDQPKLDFKIDIPYDAKRIKWTK